MAIGRWGYSRRAPLSIRITRLSDALQKFIVLDLDFGLFQSSAQRSSSESQYRKSFQVLWSSLLACGMRRAIMSS